MDDLKKNLTSEAEVFLNDQPVVKSVGKKKKKKVSGGSGPRSRSSRQKEIQSIQALQEKSKGF